MATRLASTASTSSAWRGDSGEGLCWVVGVRHQSMCPGPWRPPRTPGRAAPCDRPAHRHHGHHSQPCKQMHRCRCADPHGVGTAMEFTLGGAPFAAPGQLQAFGLVVTHRVGEIAAVESHYSASFAETVLRSRVIPSRYFATDLRGYR